MKKTILLSSVAVMSAVVSFAQNQNPQIFNYQGAVRNPDGTPMGNKSVNLRLSIVNDPTSTASEYFEVRTVKTNALGLYSVAVGSTENKDGNQLLTSKGEFSKIAWGAGVKYFKVEIDPNGGNDFTVAGSSRIAAVPYALYAEKGGSSAFNYWSNLPENKGKTEADFIKNLKNQAASGIIDSAQNLTANSEIAGVLTVTNGEGAVLKAAVVKLNKAAFDSAARQATLDGLDGTNGADGTSQKLIDAINKIVKDGINGTDGALKDAVNNVLNQLISDSKINGKDASVNNDGKNANGQILTFNAGNQAVLKDLQLILDKTALTGETKKSIIDGLNGVDGTQGLNGLDGQLQDAINKAVTNGLNGIKGTDGADGVDGVNTKLAGSITNIIETAINGGNVKGKALIAKYAAATPEANKFMTIGGNGTEALLKDASLDIDPTKFNQAVSDALTGANGANGADGQGGAAGTNGLGKDLAKTAASASVLDIVAITGGKKSQLTETSLGIDKTGFESASKQSVIDGINGVGGVDGINASLQDAINKAVTNGINGTNGTPGVNTSLQSTVTEIVSKNAANAFAFGAPNVALTGANDIADAVSGTIIPGADGTPASIKLNAAGDNAKGIVSNQDIKQVINGTTNPDGTTTGGIGNKLSTASFIKASNVENKAVLEALTLDVDQDKFNDATAQTLTNGKADGSNPLADQIKNVTSGTTGIAASAVQDVIVGGANAAAITAVKGADNIVTLTPNVATDAAPGVVTLADVRNAVSGGGNPTDPNRLNKGSVAGQNIVDASTEILIVDPNTNTTFDNVNVKLNKTALANQMKQSMVDGLNGVDGADGTKGTDAANTALQSTITDAVSKNAANAFTFDNQANALTTDVAAGKLGVITPGSAGAPASINLTKATETLPGVTSLADVKDAVAAGILNGKAGAPGAAGVDGKLASVINTTIKEQSSQNFEFAAPGVHASDVANAPVGTITPGTETTPAQLVVNAAAINAKGVVSLTDIRNAVSGGGNPTDPTRLNKGSVAGTDVVEAGTQILNVDPNTNTTFDSVSIKLNKTVLANTVKQSLVDGINGVDGADGTKGTDAVNTALQTTITDAVSKNAANAFVFGAPNAALTGADDLANAISGTITPGAAGAPASIKLNAASDNAKGIVSKTDVKEIINGTTNPDGTTTGGIGNPLTTKYAASTPDANKFMTVGGNGAVALLKDASLDIDPTKFNQAVSDALTGANGANGADGLGGAAGTNGLGKDLAKTAASASVLDIVAITGGTKSQLTETSLGIDKTGFDNASKQSVIDGVNGVGGVDGINASLQDAINKAVTNGINGTNGTPGVNTLLQSTVTEIVSKNAANAFAFGAPNAALTGADDVADAVSGTIIPGADGTPASIKLNAAGDNAKGIVSNQDIKQVINGTTNPDGTTTGGIGNKLSTASFITASNVENKAVLEALTLSVDQDKFNDAAAQTLTNGKADGTNPLADQIKNVTSGTTGIAASAVQDVIVSGTSAAAITAVKGADNIVTLTPNAATDAAPGVVTLAEVRNAVSGGGNPTDPNRLNKGSVAGQNIVDASTEILIVDPNTNTTFDNVNVKLNKTALANQMKQSMVDGLNGVDGADGTKGTDAANTALQTTITDAVSKNASNAFTFDDQANALTSAAAAGKLGVITPGTAGAPASINLTKATETLPGITSLADIRNAVSGGGNPTDPNRLNKGSVAGTDVVEAGTQILNVVPNTNTTFDSVNIKLNKTVLANTVKQSLIDGINGVDGADGTKGTDAVNTALQTTITDAVSKNAANAFVFGAPNAALTGADDVADAISGTITPGAAGAPASIKLNAASDNAKGIVSNQDIKQVINGTTNPDGTTTGGIGNKLSTASFITVSKVDNKAILEALTLDVDQDKFNDAAAQSLTNGKADGTNPLADQIRNVTSGTTGIAASAVQNVIVGGANAAALTAVKGADNIVTLTPVAATDAAPGVVTLAAVREAVSGTTAGTNRLDKGTISKTAGADNIITINGGANSTFQNVDFAVTKGDVQSAVAEGLVGTGTPATGMNPALVNAVNNLVQNNAASNLQFGEAGAAPTGATDVANAKVGTVVNGNPATLVVNKAGENAPGVLSKSEVKGIINGTVNPDGTTTGGIGAALTSNDITVTGGDKAVLNATTLAIKAGAITTDKLADAAVTVAKLVAPTGSAAGLILSTNADGTVAYKAPVDQVTRFGRQSITATAGQTSFPVTDLPADITKVFAFRNGIKLDGAVDYTVSAGNLTIVPAAFAGGAVAAGDIIEVQFAK